MSEKPRRSWQRRVLSLLICLGVGWLIYWEAMNLVAWHFARETAKKYPNLEVVPSPLADVRVEQLDGVLFEKFGISFRVPWKEMVQDRTATTISIISFKEGGGLLIFNPADETDSVKQLQGTTPQQQKRMAEVFGLRTLSSNYQLMATEVAAVPSDVKWLATRSTNVRNMILLMNKALNVKDVKAIYRINVGSWRGFQYGDPMVAPYNVKLDLFDGSDWHYKLMIVGQNEHRPVITQAQINGLVASFHGLSGRRYKEFEGVRALWVEWFVR